MRIVQTMNNALTEHRTERDLWIAAAVAGLNAAVSMGFGIATVASQHSTTSWFAGDRSAVLVALLIAVVALRRPDGLLLVGSALVAVQAVDAVIRGSAGAFTDAVGPAVLALLTAVALIRMQRAPGRAAVGLRRPTTG